MEKGQGEKQDKAGFTDAGEALGCIGLDQAWVQAIERARANTGFHGPDYAQVGLFWEEIDAEESEDCHEVRLSFRHRQVLSGPSEQGRRVGDGGKPPPVALIRAAMGSVVIAGLTVGVMFAASACGGGGTSPAPTVSPSGTPAPAPATAPAVVPALGGTATPIPGGTSTPTPRALPTAIPTPTATVSPAPAPATLPVLDPTAGPTPTLTMIPSPTPPLTPALPPVFLAEWGSKGSGDGQFNFPLGIAVDGPGNVYVADNANDRVQVFDGSGRFLAKWGSSGEGDGQLNGPAGIGVDGERNIYVAEWGNNRVQVFDAGGRFLRRWGTKGSGVGQFVNPWGVVLDGAGNVYVTDMGGHRVQVFGQVRS